MENIKLEITGVEHTKEITMKKINDPSRVGDMAEHYAITYLWDKDYQVFKNCGSTGPIDMVAIDKEGNVKLIDVKSYKDGRLSSRSKTQKQLGVQYLHYNSETRKLKFINHRAKPNYIKGKQLELF
tara:strand:- start:682 stop:1059 length:378 start_codon:yes stop_codon:yes gene_type:complete